MWVSRNEPADYVMSGCCARAFFSNGRMLSEVDNFV